MEKERLKEAAGENLDKEEKKKKKRCDPSSSSHRMPQCSLSLPSGTSLGSLQYVADWQQ